jgi:exodeoxyribonuclease VII large subunit
MTVSEFTDRLRALVDREFGTVFIAGEISGCRLPSSGHYYFTLKDEEAQLSAVCYKSTARYLKFKPQDGVAVIARGRLDVYGPRGQYQLIVDSLEPQGYGALQFALEQLKKKLAMEGLFDAARKRALPKLPRRIGLVTSPTGAVVQDMLNILSRRFPGLHIRLFPALVQGEGSVEAVCRGLDHFSQGGWADIVIVARGGGSLEDLWTFNEERVARAIVRSRVPVISAIGHETDFTIADFVADLRAPTPSAAAEMVICTREQLLEQIAGCRRKLQQAARYRVALAARRLHEMGVDRTTATIHRAVGRRAQRIDDSDYRLRERIRTVIESRVRRVGDLETRLRRRDVQVRFAEGRHRLAAAQSAMAQAIRNRLSEAQARLHHQLAAQLRSALERRTRSAALDRHRIERADRSLEYVMTSRLARARGRLESVIAGLGQLNPERVLERGYAIVQREDGTVVKAAADAPPGTDVRIRLAAGRLRAVIKS